MKYHITIEDIIIASFLYKVSRDFCFNAMIGICGEDDGLEKVDNE